MTSPVWQATVTDDTGDVLPGAQIDVVIESTGTDATLFSNRAGTTSLSNPFFADSEGFAQFYTDAGAYRITATASGGGTTRTWRYVSLFDFDANVGTAAGEVPLNSTLVPKAGGTFTGDITYYGGGGVSTNTSYGSLALTSNTTGGSNAANGYYALFSNTTGNRNTAHGYAPLNSNTTGNNNTATGYNALYSNTTGSNNTANGDRALSSNTTGDDNTANGYQALYFNTEGDRNTAYGYEALRGNTTYSNTSGFGFNAQVTASDQVQLGNSATTTYVYGTVQDRSDLRDKADVRDTILGLDFITALRPVDYRWDLRDDYKPDAPTEPEPLKDDATEQDIQAHELALSQYENDCAEWLIAVKHENLIHDGTHKRTRYHHGVIAQEVAEVIAESGIDFGGYQDHKVSGGEDVLSIGYDELIGPLIKALQEVNQKFDALKEEFDDYVETHP